MSFLFADLKSKMAAMTGFAWISQVARSIFTKTEAPQGQEAIELEKQVRGIYIIHGLYTGTIGRSLQTDRCRQGIT